MFKSENTVGPQKPKDCYQKGCCARQMPFYGTKGPVRDVDLRISQKMKNDELMTV